MYIFIFGVVGTIITFSVIAPLTYIANSRHAFYLSTEFTDEINSTIIQHNNTHTPVHFSAVSQNSDATPKSEILDEMNLTVLSEDEKINTNTDNNEPAKPVEDRRGIYLSMKEILLFSSVISATDSVAALTFIKEENEPKLFAILFGEGVINDAVCIVLYRIIKDFFVSSNTGKIK
jgi:hypothetical protein